MEYLSKCRQQGGVSSPGEFYWFLNKFQQVSRWFLYIKTWIIWWKNWSCGFYSFHTVFIYSLCLVDWCAETLQKGKWHGSGVSLCTTGLMLLNHWYTYMCLILFSLFYVTIDLVVIQSFCPPRRRIQYLISFTMRMRRKQRRWWCLIPSGWAKKWETLEKLMH